VVARREATTQGNLDGHGPQRRQDDAGACLILNAGEPGLNGWKLRHMRLLVLVQRRVGGWCLEIKRFPECR
jgi:hypothetical protein